MDADVYVFLTDEIISAITRNYNYIMDTRRSMADPVNNHEWRCNYVVQSVSAKQ